MNTTCTKRYNDLPFAHRQPNHKGHCSQIHGHNWAFEFEFKATSLDECGFVVDFGGLKWLRAWIEERFDHTLVLNDTDPWLKWLRLHLEDVTDPADGYEGNSNVKPCCHLAKIVTLPDCSSEGIAKWLYEQVNPILEATFKGRVSLTRVQVIEDTRNSATYYGHE